MQTFDWKNPMKIKLMVLALALLLLGACSNQPQPTPEPTAIPATVGEVQPSGDFLVWGLSELPLDVSEYMVDRFEEQHPGINVIISDEGWDEALRQNFENAIMMGRPPDVVIGENYFRSFAAQGELQPLDDIIAQHEGNLITATYTAATYNDHIYAVPFFTGIFGMERNCTVITAAGLDCENPPQHWDELLAESEQITASGAGDYYAYTLQGPGGTAVGSAFRIAVYQSQLDVLPCSDEACTIPDFNNPDAIPVMEFIRELVQYTPPGLLENTHEGEVYEALFRGLSAYQIAGSWHIGWSQDAGCADCRYSQIPYPREGHPANLVVGNVLFAAPADAQHPELAKEWLELLLSDEVQELVYPLLGRLPVKRSTLEALRAETDAATGVFIDELLNTDTINILPQWENNPRETWAIYNDMLTEVLTTNRPIQEIMDEAQAEVDELNN
jgi:multiple sugar transport system substrate-binding protein